MMLAIFTWILRLITKKGKTSTNLFEYSKWVCKTS